MKSMLILAFASLLLTAAAANAADTIPNTDQGGLHKYPLPEINGTITSSIGQEPLLEAGDVFQLNKVEELEANGADVEIDAHFSGRAVGKVYTDIYEVTITSGDGSISHGWAYEEAYG